MRPHSASRQLYQDPYQPWLREGVEVSKGYSLIRQCTTVTNATPTYGVRFGLTMLFPDLEL